MEGHHNKHESKKNGLSIYLELYHQIVKSPVVLWLYQGGLSPLDHETGRLVTFPMVIMLMIGVKVN